MSQKLKDLRAKGIKAAKRISELSAEFNSRKKEGKAGADLWPNDSRAQWDVANKEFDEIRAAIEAEERETEVDRRANEISEWELSSRREGRSKPGLDDVADPETGRTFGDAGAETREEANVMRRHQVDRRLAFQAWASRGVEGVRLSDEHQEACQRLKFDYSSGTLHLRFSGTDEFARMQRRLRAVHPDCRDRVVSELFEQRALSGLLGSEGAYLQAPGSLVRSIEIAMVEYGSVLQVAETMTTETGEPMSWPVGDDTSNEGAYIDENTDAQDLGETNPDFEQVVWRAYELTSKFIKAPYSLIRDSLINIDLVLGAMIGERIGRKLSGECTTGTNKIKGIVTRSAAGQTSAGANAITYADIVGLEHSVDPALRAGAGFMFHDVVLEALRLLEDDNSRPLWVSNVANGAPDTLNGRPYTINQKMSSSIATTLKTMLFGRLNAYKVRRVGPSLRLQRLVERFAEKGQIAFIGYASADGNLLRPSNANACPVKYLVQA